MTSNQVESTLNVNHLFERKKLTFKTLRISGKSLKENRPSQFLRGYCPHWSLHCTLFHFFIVLSKRRN